MCQDPLLIRERLFQGIDGDYNVLDMGIVSEVMGELENFHFTKEALEATRLGKHINELRRKSSDKHLASRAKNLVKKWRGLLSAPDSGPPPGGGGNNNNSLAATNGNTAARLAAAAANVSPGLPARSNISPGLPLRSNISPGLPLRSNISPGLHLSSIAPGLQQQLRNNLSPAMGRNNLSPGGVMRANMSPSLSGRPNAAVLAAAGKRSARPSPSVSRSATPRVSPATVTISSSGSSPNNSRPGSPQGGFRPINPPGASLPNSRSPSPDIEIIEEVVKTPRLVSNHKRLRREESDVRLLESAAAASKRPKLDYAHQNGGTEGGAARDEAAPASDSATTPRPLPPPGGGNNKQRAHPPDPQQQANMLNKQISMAKRSGKVKTTQELIENLGIESSRQHAASPPVPHSVNNLVPDENKEELMNRFFESQERVRDDDEESAIEILSRPNTAIDPPTSSSNSAVSSRVHTPVGTAAAPPTTAPAALQTVEEVLAQLSPIPDPAAVIAEWEAHVADEEEIEGLIPVYKPRLDITEQVIHDLNNDGQLEHIGGVRDHTGAFKEWHEMVSQESLGGDLLHILPYSVID